MERRKGDYDGGGRGSRRITDGGARSTDCRTTTTTTMTSRRGRGGRRRAKVLSRNGATSNETFAFDPFRRVVNDDEL